MSQTEDASLSNIDADQLAKIVADIPDEQLAEMMASDGRQLVLDDIFRRMAEHLDADRARGLSAVVHWKIFDRPDGGYDHYEVVLDDGKCVVSPTPTAEPRLTLKLAPVPFLKLVSGNASGPIMFMTGKLKLEGDVMLASQLTSLFRIPQAG